MAQVEAMSYARPLPWTDRGVWEAPDNESGLTSEEFLARTGLNWTVSVKPAAAILNPDGKVARIVRADRFRMVVRDDTNEILGAVGTDYRPVQNGDGIDCLDQLVVDGKMRYVTGGYLLGSRLVYALGRLEQTMRVLDDDYYPYVLFSNRHDSWGSSWVFPTPVRVRCWNTHQMAISGAYTSGFNTMGLRIQHSGDINFKLAEARKVLNVTTETMRRYAKWLEAAAKEKATKAKREAVMRKLFGVIDGDVPAQRQKKLELFQSIYDQEINQQGDNAYSLFQAVTGYADHAMKYNGGDDDDATLGDKRMLAILGGKASVLKVKGMEAITQSFRLPAVAMI